MQLQQIFGRPPKTGASERQVELSTRERAVQLQRKILRKLHKKPVAVAFPSLLQLRSAYCAYA